MAAIFAVVAVAEVAAAPEPDILNDAAKQVLHHDRTVTRVAPTRWPYSHQCGNEACGCFCEPTVRREKQLERKEHPTGLCFPRTNREATKQQGILLVI